jgi:hypothetical protein
MPLKFSTESLEDVAKNLSLASVKPAYLVVYASAVEGRMWCSDCRDAESFVNAKFGDSGKTATAVYAGLKPEWVFAILFVVFWPDEMNRWKSPDNVWKQEPFLVTALPTIIKVKADGVSSRKNHRVIRADFLAEVGEAD